MTSNAGDGVECPVCWESFDNVQHSPHALWCGHTLCMECVLGLPNATYLALPHLPVQVPGLISCPWCKWFTLRWVFKGHLQYPRKNFSLLWVLESLKLRKAAAESLPRPRSATPSPRGTSRQGSQNVDTFYQPAYPGTQIRSQTSWLSMGRLRVRGQQRGHSAGVHVGAPLARTTRFLLKLPLVFLLFFIIFLILPISAGILFVYFFTSLFFTIPCSAVAIGAISCAEVLIRNILS